MPNLNTNTQYTNVQYIAYHLATLGKIQPGAPDPNSQIGKGLDANAAALLQRFAGVLSFAKVVNEIDRKPTTLKIFMAPEFYFKGTSSHWGSFMINTMTNILAELQKIGTPGQDWLVVAGSIVFYLPAGSDPNVKNYKKLDGKALTPNESVYANVAPVLGDGTNFTYVLKHEVSQMDGPPEDHAIVEADAFQPLVDTWAEHKARFIAAGNRTLGLEICLDHGTQELQKAIREYKANEKGAAAPALDLHVITACGMAIQQPLARVGGYVLLCDGVGHGANQGSEMVKVLGGGNTQQVPVQARHALPANLQMTTRRPNLPQEVVVYQSVPLP